VACPVVVSIVQYSNTCRVAEEEEERKRYAWDRARPRISEGGRKEGKAGEMRMNKLCVRYDVRGSCVLSLRAVGACVGQ
jgi:hypothetical protein